jgi:hypothetical protein
MEVDDSGGGGDDEGEALPMVEERVVGRQEEVLIANDEGEGEGDHDMDVVVVVHDDMDHRHPGDWRRLACQEGTTTRRSTDGMHPTTTTTTSRNSRRRSSIDTTRNSMDTHGIDLRFGPYGSQ